MMRNRTIAAVLGATATAVCLMAGALPAQASTGDVNHGMSSRHAASSASTSGGNLAYKGGNVVTAPHIYIVYWGSQWGSTSITNDPSGEASLQQRFFSAAYGSGDTYFTSQTQYCQGVAVGTTQCNGAGTAVGHPSSNPLQGTWLDSSAKTPSRPSSSAIAAEAVKAAAHFGVSGDNVQVIVDLPTGVAPQGFKTSYCAWHNHTSTGSGADLPYTNMPYITDAGSGCGANFVAPGSTGVNGATEGITIVGGHEYAETITDPAPSSGWLDGSGAETGDKCAWISSGQGASSIIGLNGSNFAVQSLWSNNFNSNAGGCVTSYTSATNQH
jgi:serine protease